MAKLSLKELKKMIREAVRESMKEQISGLGTAATGRKRRGYMGGTAGRPQRMGAMTVADLKPKGLDVASFSLEELVAVMKDNPNLADSAKKKVKQQIMKLLKQAGW